MLLIKIMILICECLVKTEHTITRNSTETKFCSNGQLSLLSMKFCGKLWALLTWVSGYLDSLSYLLCVNCCSYRTICLLVMESIMKNSLWFYCSFWAFLNLSECKEVYSVMLWLAWKIKLPVNDEAIFCEYHGTIVNFRPFIINFK